MSWLRWAAAAAIVCGGMGCDGDDPGMDAGIDAGPMVDEDAGPGGTDAGTDAGEPGALGAPCQEAAECESGVCSHFTSALELGTGFCSHDCAMDADCSDIPDDGFTLGCVAESAFASRCHRVCDDGFGCQEGAFCVNNWGFQSGNTADLCLDLRNDGCASNDDCTDPERCTILVDRERGTQACFAARQMDGSIAPLRTTGDTCDPSSGSQPCSAVADCPTDYLCQDNGQGQRVCVAPVDQRCHLLCITPGICSGLCEEDGDCPADMRCSRSDFSYIGNTPGVFDDGYVNAGFCTYAAGSGTSCVADEDCMTTGAGGAAEVCWPTPDSAGAAAPICVTPPAGYGLEGAACGDDPTTDGTRETRFCAGGSCVNRQCGGTCDSAADCPSGWRCLEQYISSTLTLKQCADARVCTDDTGCNTGEICQGIATSTAGYERICTTPNGALTAGDTCEAAPNGFNAFADTCEAFCFNFGEVAANARCTELCAVDGDCPGAEWRCGQFQQTINNAGTYPDRTDDLTGEVGLCSYLPGSQTTCTLNADCPTGERCLGFIDLAGTVSRLCITEIAGGRDTGQACSATQPCAGRVCIPRWDDPSTSFCAAFCGVDGDCPTGFACLRANLDNPDFTETICMPMGDPRGTAP